MGLLLADLTVNLVNTDLVLTHLVSSAFPAFLVIDTLISEVWDVCNHAT